jgi:hypothetical protein
MGADPSSMSDLEYEDRQKILVYGNVTERSKIDNSLYLMSEKRSCNRGSKIVIVNNSKFDLHYVNFGQSSGQPFSEVLDAFGGPNNTIENNKVGGIFHTKKAHAACGSVGYVSLLIKSPGKRYIVILGWDTHYEGKNCAGIQIRAEDGVTDGAGNVTGHGVNPTGAMPDANVSLYNVTHAQTDKKSFHVFGNETRHFKITCKFTDEKIATYVFTVDDV